METLETFILRTSLTSPFGRKVRMAGKVLGLGERMEIRAADTGDPEDSLRAQNPLGKIPCLITPNGGSIYDSRVAIEYLQHFAAVEQLLPSTGTARYKVLTQMTLADGIIDAGALVIYERRYHPTKAQSDYWIDYQCEKIRRALEAFEKMPPNPRVTDGVTIGLSCALGFLDKRDIIDWRAGCRILEHWLAEFADHEPAYYETQPPS